MRTPCEWRRTTTLLCVGLVASGFVGCKKDPSLQESVEDPVGAVVAGVKAEPKNCFDNRLEYCLDDDALLLQAVETCLQKRVRSEVRTKGDVKAAVRKCGYGWKSAQLDAHDRVEARVREYYESPRVDEKKSKGGALDVVVHLGLVPGALKKHRAGYAMAPKPELAASGFLTAAEASRQVMKWARKYRHARSVRLEVDIRRHSTTEKRSYEWSHLSKSITVRPRTGVSRQTHWVSAPYGSDIEAIGRGEVKLGKDDLKPIYPDR